MPSIAHAENEQPNASPLVRPISRPVKAPRLTSLPDAALERILKALDAWNRVRLSATCKRLLRLDASCADLWSEMTVQLTTPSELAQCSKWLARKQGHVEALRIELYGTAAEAECAGDDSDFRTPIAQLLGTVGLCTRLARLEVAADCGMRIAPVRLFSRDLFLPALESLCVAGALAVDLEMHHLVSLTELRLGGALGPGTQRLQLCLPPMLRTLALPREFGMPAGLSRATHLRALSATPPLPGGISHLKTLTFLTALSLEGELAEEHQRGLSALTGLERLAFASAEPAAFKPLLALTRLSMLVFTCRRLKKVPTELARLPALKVLALNSAKLSKFAGEPEDLGVEDITLDLNAAAKLAARLPALPALRTLRLGHRSGGLLDQATVNKLGAVMEGAAALPALQQLVLSRALSGAVEWSTKLQAQVAGLQRGRGLAVRQLRELGGAGLQPQVV